MQVAGTKPMKAIVLGSLSMKMIVVGSLSMNVIVVSPLGGVGTLCGAHSLLEEGHVRGKLVMPVD